jgi:hypothetical protein
MHRYLQRTQIKTEEIEKRDDAIRPTSTPMVALKYPWADTEDPDFVVVSNNPNSCYTRYANDPLDDEKCNAELKRIGNTVYLIATREIRNLCSSRSGILGDPTGLEHGKGHTGEVQP